MPVTVNCQQCGKLEAVRPSRAKNYKFCSYDCQGAWRQVHWRQENNPKFTGGIREKDCQNCGKLMIKPRLRAISVFDRQKFCCKPCADVAGLRYTGPDNPNWNGSPRRNHRGGPHASWARQVISRDHATCQKCGVQGVELHAHHVVSYKEAPELRYEVSNGLTVCHRCHWEIHSGRIANGVNSGEAAAGHAGGNPEPSHQGNLVEGVTTRGRAYRRWECNCTWCGTFVSKRLSSVTRKDRVFCSNRCSGKWTAANRTYRPWKSPTLHGGNASTSALPETDDIVWTHVKA
jgi:hypothetical protein